MADATYSPLVYMKRGGDEQVIADGGKQTVESGGSIDVVSGGKITDDGTQASHIADASGGTYGTGVEAKINAIIAALEGVGILATS